MMKSTDGVAISVNVFVDFTLPLSASISSKKFYSVPGIRPHFVTRLPWIYTDTLLLGCAQSNILYCFYYVISFFILFNIIFLIVGTVLTISKRKLPLVQTVHRNVSILSLGLISHVSQLDRNERITLYEI